MSIEGMQKRMPRGTACVAALLVLFSSLSAAAKDGLELYGDIGQIAIPALAAVVSFAKEDSEGVVQLAAGTGLTLGLVTGLKFATDRRRPDGGARSFPSGHAAAAFAGASYLHYRYGWKWGVPAYAAAAVVGYSRVSADRHYWYDVVTSAAIANLVAYVVTDTIDEKIVIIPIVNLTKKNFGLLAQFHF